MTAVRDFLVAFAISTAALMALVSFVFLGSTLMNQFAGLTDYVGALIASGVVAVLLAIPMAAVGTSARSIGFAGNSAV